MKKIIVLMIILLFPVSAFAQSPMKLVYFDNYPPFSWKDNNQMKGILVDVLTEVIQTQMGIQVSHEGYPWARAQMMVKVNKADAFVTVPTLKRRSYTEISTEPVIVITASFFVSKKSLKLQALLTAKTLSDVMNYNHIQYIGNGWANQNLGDMNVRWVSTLRETLYCIAKNQYDVFVENSIVARFNIKKFGYQDQIIEIPSSINRLSFNLCIRKKSPYVNILPKFNVAIIEMRKSGRLQEIYDRY